MPKARQAAAVNFLNENAFATPTWALKPEILRRIEPNGALDRVRTAQGRVLNSLLSSARISRMVEVESIDGAAAYAPTDMLNDVRKGIFGRNWMRPQSRWTPTGATCSARTWTWPRHASTRRKRARTTTVPCSAAS